MILVGEVKPLTFMFYILEMPYFSIKFAHSAEIILEVPHFLESMLLTLLRANLRARKYIAFSAKL